MRGPGELGGPVGSSYGGRPLRQGLHAVPCTVRHAVPCAGRPAVNTPTEPCSRRLCLEVSGAGMQGEGGQETPLQ